MCVCERERDGVNGAAERQLSWGEGLQATPVSLLPTLNKQTRAPGQQDSDLGALPGTTLAPVSQGTHLLSCSKQGSHTRTSFSMPNLGMVEYLEEHLPQKIWPHARQWCCDTGWVREAWSATLHDHHLPSTACCRKCQAGPPRLGWAEGELGRPQRTWGTGHTRELPVIGSTLRKSSHADKKSSHKNT